MNKTAIYHCGNLLFIANNKLEKNSIIVFEDEKYLVYKVLDSKADRNYCNQLLDEYSENEFSDIGKKTFYDRTAYVYKIVGDDTIE